MLDQKLAIRVIRGRPSREVVSLPFDYALAEAVDLGDLARSFNARGSMT